MFPVLFQFGPITVYTYGFMILLGVISSYFYCYLNRQDYALPKEFLADIYFGVVVFGFLGARLLFIMINFVDFLGNPLSYVFTSAGFVFFGGFVSAIAYVVYFCKKKKVNVWSFLDLAAPASALAHAFGRLGCFFYGCCYGKIGDSLICLKFPIESPAGAHGHPVIPTQLIESALLFVLFFFLAYLNKKFKRTLLIPSLYLIIYGVLRFSVELFRGDPRGLYFGLATSQWFSLVAFICGILLLVGRKKILKTVV